MKKQKFLLLGMALALVLILASCSGGVPHDGGCFEFEDDELYTSVRTLEGDVVARNSEYNLIALENIEHSADGSVIRKISVIDLLTGKAMFTSTDNLDSDRAIEDKEVDLSSYPLIKISYWTETYADGDYRDVCYTDVYRISDRGSEYGAETLAYNVEYDSSSSTRIGNMFVLCVEDKVLWVGADLEVVREIPGEIHNSYVTGGIESFFNIAAENNGYLYAWEFGEASRMAVVYGPDGKATAKYTFSSGAIVAKDESGALTSNVINPKLFVLDDGNMLVQQCIAAEEDYDFIYLGEKLKLVTSIVDYRDGTSRDVECGFIIEMLESEYEGEHAIKSAFPLDLSGKYENQAYVRNIVNGMLDTKERYVVLNGDGEVVYELKNDYLALESGYATITDADEDGYVAQATVYGVTAKHRFNYNGDIIYTRPTGYRGETDELYFTNNGIYEKGGKLVFDIEKSDFAGNPWFAITNLGNRIALYKLNFETGKLDCYLYDEELGEPVLFADGKYSSVDQFDQRDLYTVYDSDKEVTAVYNLDGEVVAKASGRHTVAWCKDAAYIELEIAGEKQVYVITVASDSEEGTNEEN